MAAGLERWRALFRGVDIFEVIEKAILVAASDAPEELRRRRDRITERLFTAPLAPPRCLGAGSMGRVVAQKESNLDCSNGTLGVQADDDDYYSDDERLRRAAVSNYGQSYDDDNEEEAQREEGHKTDELLALTDKIDEESQIVGEVIRIKEFLVNYEEQSHDALFQSLRMLQLMQLSFETLEATGIGRAVNRLRKHSSQKICVIAHTLVDGWKVLVDEWISTTNAAIADKSPPSSTKSVVDDGEGLPSPPLDEGAFLFATQTTSIQLSDEFFDGMDDDGNVRNNNNDNGNDGNTDNKREKYGWRPSNRAPIKKQQPGQSLLGEDQKIQFTRQELLTRQKPPAMRQTKSPNPQDSGSQVKPGQPIVYSGSGPGQPLKAFPEQKPCNEMKHSRQTQDSAAVAIRPAVGHVDKPRIPVQASAEGKTDDTGLEEMKRKLHKCYEEAEKAKKQRTIQVLELADIPELKHQNRKPFMKSRNHIRSREIPRL